jgi:hypothetical protein
MMYMTKSIHFVGDSHIVSFYNAILLEDGFQRKYNKYGHLLYPNENYWTAYNPYTDQEYSFHSKPGKLAYKIDYSYMKFSHNIKAGDIVIASIGECDIRLYLHKYNNTKEVVEAYVRETLAHFAENRVFFLTPIPPIDQVYEVHLKGDYYQSDPAPRILEHANFVKYLKKECSRLSLPEPIDIGFGSDVLGIENRDHDSLHISEEHSAKVVKEIFKRQDLHL